MPIEKDPWDVPLEEKVELLRSVTARCRRRRAVLFAIATAGFEYEWKYPGHQRRIVHRAGVSLHQLQRLDATARTGAQVKTRNYERLAGAGYEFLAQVRSARATPIASPPKRSNTRWPKPVGQG